MKLLLCFLIAALVPLTASAADLEFEHWKADFGIYAIYDSQNYEGDIFTSADITTTNTNFLRRVKASTEIEFLDKWSFELALDYHDYENETQLDDLNLNYQINDSIEFTIGKFKEPLGLENQLSLRFQPLHERSVGTRSLLFGRQSGIAFDIEQDYYTVDLAMTYQEAPSNQYRDSLAHIARFTFAPIQKKKQFLHFGFDFSNRLGTEDKYDIDEPIIAVGVGNLLHSPNFEAQEIKLSGVEFAWRYRPLLVYGEHFTQRIKQEGLADQSMYGYYTTAVYTLLGNSRTYKHGKLKFKDKKDHTLEIALRHSVTKLTPIFKGNDTEVTSVALSYFYKKHARISAEYQEADLIDNGNVNSEQYSGDSINLRLQLSY